MRSQAKTDAQVRSAEFPFDPRMGRWQPGDLGGDAVEGLALEGHVVGGAGDLAIQVLQALRHLGMGDLEAQVGEVLAFELGQALLGLGQLDADAGPLGAGQALEGLTQREFSLGGQRRLAAQLVPLPQPGVLGQGQAPSLFAHSLAPGHGGVTHRGVPPRSPPLGLVQLRQLLAQPRTRASASL